MRRFTRKVGNNVAQTKASIRRSFGVQAHIHLGPRLEVVTTVHSSTIHTPRVRNKQVPKRKSKQMDVTLRSSMLACTAWSRSSRRSKKACCSPLCCILPQQSAPVQGISLLEQDSFLFPHTHESIGVCEGGFLVDNFKVFLGHCASSDPFCQSTLLKMSIDAFTFWNHSTCFYIIVKK